MEAKLPTTAWVAAILGLWIGCWLIFDAMHHVVYGDFVRLNGQLGPWVALAAAVGIEPATMKIPLLLIGAAWVISSIGLTRRKGWAWIAASVLAAVTLLYCCIGTIFAATTLVLLLLKRTRVAFRPGRS